MQQCNRNEKENHCPFFFARTDVKSKRAFCLEREVLFESLEMEIICERLSISAI